MPAYPIPEGYTTITPYLVVDGAAEAIAWYQRALGAEERFRMPGPDGRVMHAEIKVGNSVVMLGDSNVKTGCKGPKVYGGSPVSFYTYVGDVDAAFARAIKAGGKQTMPVTDMFWGDRMGAFEDPFGHAWTLASHVRDLTPEQMAAGQKEWMEKMAKG
jgi:uncharacterized glyoxalase superfamily protein PhnB